MRSYQMIMVTKRVDQIRCNQVVKWSAILQSAMRQVIGKIKTLEAEGYISNSRYRKYNEYSLSAKLAIKDDHGRPRALAQWRCHQVDRSIPISISTKFLGTPLPHAELADNDGIT